MYATLDGAKDRAKSLKRLFDDSGIDYTLNRCQTAIARAGGFKDWHDLETGLRNGRRELDPETYRRRLRAALPLACHGPLLASWSGGPLEEESGDPDIPRNFFRDVWPYVMAAEVIYRSRTPLLRPGSGAGQRLRLALVQGPLINIHGGPFKTPTLDPETLALGFSGGPAAIFRDEAEHPRFEQELAALTEAGIVSISEDRRRGPVVRIHAPPGLQDEVLRQKVLMVDYSAEIDERHADDDSAASLTDSVTAALSALGIEDARRTAEAILKQDAPGYRTPSGAILDLLQALASEGRIEALGHAYGLFARVRRSNAAFVAAQIPGIIDGHLARTTDADSTTMQRWFADHPTWAEDLKAVLGDPRALETLVAGAVASLAETGVSRG